MSLSLCVLEWLNEHEKERREESLLKKLDFVHKDMYICLTGSICLSIIIKS